MRKITVTMMAICLSPALGHISKASDIQPVDGNVFQNQVLKDEGSKKDEPEVIYRAVEQPPVFPGGDGELLRFISTHLRYPKKAIANNIQGIITVEFVVKADGSIGDAVVTRGKDASLDAEAIRVIKSLPKFQPGKHDGQPVAVWYMVPVRFKLRANI